MLAKYVRQEIMQNLGKEVALRMKRIDVRDDQ